MTGVSDIDWMVISLKRTPERLEQFAAINAHLGLPFETLEAVDGLELDLEGVVRSGVMAADLRWVPGALGAALSHRLCWLRAIKSGHTVCIFEDDVFLRHDFVSTALGVLDSLPKGWDIVHFGFNTDSVLDVQLVPGCDIRGHFGNWYPTLPECGRFARSSGAVVPARLYGSFGTAAYAVSPAGARKLIEGCFPLSKRNVRVEALSMTLQTKTHDGLMNGLYRDIGAYVCLPPIALPINDKTVSTVNVI